MTTPGIVIASWMYWPAAVLAAGGLVLLYLGLLRDRARGRRRCPRCWYDMAAARSFPARCPECGAVADAEPHLLRTRRRWLLAACGVFLLLPLLAVFGRFHGAAAYYALMPRWRLDDRCAAGDVTVSIYSVRNPDERGTRIKVIDRGRNVLDETDYSITVTGFNHAHPAFIDLNADGVQECIVECYSGGAHCCYRVYVLELRPGGVHVAADIDAQNGMAAVPPTAGAGEWLLNIPDQSFVYWKAPYVASPRPPVYYRLQEGALRTAVEKMQGALDPAAAGELARGTLPRDEPAFQVLNPGLWGTMLTLIYNGDEPLAWTFFDGNWRGTAEQKEAFRKEFLGVLAADPWYQDFTAAKAARDAGRPIPPSTVGMSGRAGKG